MNQQICNSVWKDKYAYGNEQSIADTFNRVIDGVYEKDTNIEEREEARELIHRGHILPAGRILAGAGTPKRVSWVNCFVSPLIQDSLDTIRGEPGKGIMDALKDAALTQQMGGGIGMDFSTIRPNGAVVKRTGSVSSGILPFMDMWSAMCSTIMSSGSRRGAQMGTLAIWHPDVQDFITAKQTAGRLKNFNVSVLVTDAFMQALEANRDWDLYFTVPRADGNHVEVYNVDGETRYVYRRIKARKLWDMIIENTYIHAEPGVIFIDRVNKENNLSWVEYIHCCNPCSEQFLPPNGDCNLGHVNLATMVLDPFTSQAQFDFVALDRAAACMVRFLDNVLEVTKFPTEDQYLEAMNKRRIGLGYTGLANALQQLGIRYGSPQAIEMTRRITQRLAVSAYSRSVELARERGPFPLFAEKYLQAPFIKKLPANVRAGIALHGVRNGVLLSIAPTGTTSIIAGNVSSGIEPVFMHEYTRKVLQPDGVTLKPNDVYDYGYLLYREKFPNGNLPDYFVTANELTVREHLEMQAAAQEWVDSAISKTVNAPTEMTLDEFKGVYHMAYNLGLKGCTTYRPDPRSSRGAVLSEKKEEFTDRERSEDKAPKTAENLPSGKVTAHAPAPMQDELDGRRYRVKWPDDENAYYITINDYVDPKGVRRPFEIFINTKSPQHHQWINALTRTISAIFRREDNVEFLAEELQQVFAMSGGGIFYKQKHIPSLVAMIGVKIEEHLRWLGLLDDDEPAKPSQNLIELMQHTPLWEKGDICTYCHAPAVIREGGCAICKSCGHSRCG